MAGRSVLSVLGHLGAFGLLFLAIIDSSPLPGFGGPDIVTAILAARQKHPWFEFAAAATAGSVIGAFITYSLAREAGHVYLERFGKTRVLHEAFRRRGAVTLMAITAVPFPAPTSLVFAAAGVSQYPPKKFLTIVAAARAIRYGSIAILAERYGNVFVHVVRHPTRSLDVLLVLGILLAIFIAVGITVNRRWISTPAH